MSKNPPKTAKVPASSIEHPRRQVAALPWRPVEGGVEVCLVTTRETGRWTVPKGWPMKRLTDRSAARTEAEQEAGVTGKVAKAAIGAYTYWKRQPEGFDFVRVEVFPLRVVSHLATWKEQGERQVRWLPLADAALLVDEPELKTLLAAFRPLEA
ncbi:MAG: NUDIX hydrolase [Hyphomicrobiales bacterium]|nr:NUDIX hydrolase [Hyphomicrobiales bacterium]